MRVACVSSYDARDPASFGGHVKYCIRAVDHAFGSMEYIGPLEHNRIHTLIFRTKQRFYSKMRGRRYTPERDRLLLKHYARQIRRKLTDIKPDIVFSPMSPASQPIAYLDCNEPIVIWTDSCFAAIVDFYPSYRKEFLCAETYRHGMANERAALDRCAMAVYSSDWAAQSAVRMHGIDPDKVKVIPFGGNLVCDRTPDDIDRLIKKRSAKRCELLFIGNSWDRKGGALTLDIARNLNEQGMDVHLTMLGAMPPDNVDIPDFVDALGYIRKSEPAGEQRVNELIARAHFLVLPTIADCTPLVFPEANSFGVPCLSTDVGGIKTMLRDDINGKTFPLGSAAAEWCGYIESVFSDRNRYEKLARDSFREYETRLNWDVSARKLKELTESLL